MAASSKTASARSETKLVQELADILDKSGLAELEYETDAVAIRLSRVTGAAPVEAAAPAVSAPAAAAPAPARPNLPPRRTQLTIKVLSLRQWSAQFIPPQNPAPLNSYLRVTQSKPVRPYLLLRP